MRKQLYDLDVLYTILEMRENNYYSKQWIEGHINNRRKFSAFTDDNYTKKRIQAWNDLEKKYNDMGLKHIY